MIKLLIGMWLCFLLSRSWAWMAKDSVSNEQLQLPLVRLNRRCQSLEYRRSHAASMKNWRRLRALSPVWFRTRSSGTGMALNKNIDSSTGRYGNGNSLSSTSSYMNGVKPEPALLVIGNRFLILLTSYNCCVRCSVKVPMLPF